MAKARIIAISLIMILALTLLGGCEFLEYKKKMEFYKAEAEKYLKLYEDTKSLYENALTEAEKYRGLYEQTLEENEKLKGSLKRMYQ